MNFNELKQKKKIKKNKKNKKKLKNQNKNERTLINIYLLFNKTLLYLCIQL